MTPFLGIVCGLLVGVALGVMIGFMVTKMRISSWIVSLAMLFALRGVILIIAKKSVAVSGGILTFANAKFLPGVILGMKGGISTLIPMLFLFTSLCMYLSIHTKFGMGMYAVGGNGEAARMMGINVDQIKMKAFICSGLIAMCAIDGVKLSGGEGEFSGTFFGILIYFIINTIFTYLPPAYSFIGSLMLISVGVQSEVFQNIKFRKKQVERV